MSETTTRIPFLAILVFLTQACGPSPEEAAVAFADGWFARATAGERSDDLCHGLGLLKHPQFTCAELLDHAARIEPRERTLVEINHPDCFADVCGTFYELRYESSSGKETLLVKQDGNQFGAYWYRSDSLLALLRPADETEDEPDLLQTVYDEITARYPPLYQYPPCLDVRPSSSNLRGELMRRDAIDVAVVDALAAECPETFCFALVGQKIATLCP